MHDQLPLPINSTQRWRQRRASYRPAGEPIDPSAYGVDVVDDRRARAFVLEHHYSASYPAARFKAGLFRALPRGGLELVGVAVFSVPTNVATTRKYLGLDCRAGIELGRFVLVDDVPANGETFFLARALRALRVHKPEVAGVVSFSDPVARLSGDGDVVAPGHIGTIYQAHNATYLGRASSSTLILTTTGRVMSARSLSKIRNQERGADYAADALVAAGAPKRRHGEDPAEWVARALRDGPFRRQPHPGNHVYAWRLHRACSLPSAKPFPKGLCSPS